MDIIFIGTPYQDKTDGEAKPLIPPTKLVLDRMQVVTEYACYLAARGYTVVAPVITGHAMIMNYKGVESLPPVFSQGSFWYEMSRDMLRPCHQYHLLDLLGWQDSSGVADEMKACKEWGIPMFMTIPVMGGFRIEPYDYSKKFQPRPLVLGQRGWQDKGYP